MTRLFCSEIARKTESTVAGTGTHGLAYLFLPVRKSFWGAREINDSWASESLRRLINDGRKQGVVTRLFHPGPGDNDALLFTDEHADAPQVVLTLAHGIASEFGASAQRPTGSSFFICTHGTRDRCCAKWGFAAFQEAESTTEENFRAYECSHLGGDRHAATGIYFPSGNMYGRIRSGDIQFILAAEHHGRFAQDHYRGRVFDKTFTQIARFALALAKVTSSILPIEVSVTAEQQNSVILHVGILGQSFEVSCNWEPLGFFSSCKAMEEAKVSPGRTLSNITIKRLDAPDSLQTFSFGATRLSH